MPEHDPFDTRVGLQVYVEGILDEHRKAIEKADVEREKTAMALAKALEDKTVDGDERLQDHITNQIEQVRQQIASIERVSLSRKESLDHRITSMRELIDARFTATQEAVGKAENANEKF